MRCLGLRLWLILMACLALCACTTFGQAANPASKESFQHDKSKSGSVDSINNQLPIVPFSLTRLERSYYFDREDFRLKKLKDKNYGPMNYNNGFIYEKRAPAGLRSEAFTTSWYNRSSVRWSGLQYWVSERWQFSTDLPNIKDVSYDGSLAFIMPAPRLTYDLGSVKLSTLLYIPRIQDYNLIAVMGIYLIFVF